MMGQYVGPGDRTIRSMLANHKVLLIRGMLGSGKTRLLEECREVSLGSGWSAGAANVEDNSLVQVLRSLAAEVNTPNFDKALGEYLDEFRKADRDEWIEVIGKASSSVLASSAQMALLQAPGILPIALAVGSKMLTEDTIKLAADLLFGPKGNQGGLLAEEPLDRLCKAFEKDLCSELGHARTVFLIDDFEQLSFFLESYLIPLVEVSHNVTWVIAVWGDIPDWLANTDTIIWYQWEKAGLGVSELQKIDPSLTSIQMSELQGPPVFGLPIIVQESLRNLQGKDTHRGVSYPLVEHLEQWLRVEFEDKTDEVLKHLRRCSVARYLGEGVVGSVTGDLGPDVALWDWLYESPLLKGRSIAGHNRSALDSRVRSVLAHDLYRQNEKEYYKQHSRLQDYYEEFDSLRWHHRVEVWYHAWCGLSPEKSLKRGLREAAQLLAAQEYNYFRDIGQILGDIGIEREETVCLRSGGRSIIDAGEALLAEEPDWEGALSFFNLVHREIFTDLDEESQAEIWFGIGNGRLANNQYGEAREAFEEVLKIDPDDEEAREKLKECCLKLKECCLVKSTTHDASAGML